MAITIWGLDAGGGPYAAIAALVNIPATLLAVLFYEFVLADSSRSTCLLFVLLPSFLQIASAFPFPPSRLR